MAGEDKESKTEKPTARRRQESRRQGQVAKSQDLNVVFLLTAIFVGLLVFGPMAFDRIRGIVARHLAAIAETDVNLEAMQLTMASVLADVLIVVGPIAALAFAAALLANLFQVGFLVTGQPLVPNVTKLDPVRGLTRTFSLRGVAKAGFGVFKVVVIGSVLAWTLWEVLLSPDSPSVFNLLASEEDAVVAYALSAIVKLGIRGVIALLFLAAIDYAYQRWQHEKDLMMTKQEVKEEMIQMEGDPKLKGKRRKFQADLLRQSALRDVSDADVVIANPTHFAVAIQYERAEMAAPKCVAKGQDYVALKIRSIAMEHDVPIVQKPELARALCAVVEVGQEIPQEFYHAVAEVLAYVYKLSGRPAPAGV